MDVDRYQEIVKSVDQTAKLPLSEKRSVKVFGLAGEIGSLLTEIKKFHREGPASPNLVDRAKEELGDIIWYVTSIADFAGLNLRRDVLYGNLQKLCEVYDKPSVDGTPLFRRLLTSKNPIVAEIEADHDEAASTFQRYQDLAVKTSRHQSLKFLLPFLVRVWVNLGDLFLALEMDLTNAPEKKHRVEEVLGDICWYVSNIAHAYNLSLETIIDFNVAKTRSRWPGSTATPTPLFDRDCHPLEQFPRKFTVSIVPKSAEVSIMMINDVIVGDPLTDNSYTEDGYRFHDVLHLAHVAILGWSPVIRDLLKRKRKFSKRTDEADDGARARIVEEAIINLVYSYATDVDKLRLLEGQDGVSFTLLKHIKALTRGLEVHQCHYWEWEKAILKGCHLFNLLRRHKAGQIILDLYKRDIEFVPALEAPAHH